jgi:peptidyl-prolyl cis-trans isomerase SurA
VNGEANMRTLAILYSEDPGSSQKGGRYENVARGVMDPAFEAVAFRLKNGEVSNVFETAYGFHFIELITRKGELLDLRHILIMPKMTNDDFFNCKKQLDSIYKEIREGKITFEDAVKKYSDDVETKQNSGLMVNPQTASTKFDNEALNQIDENLIVTINSMQVGEISKPMQFVSQDGKPGFRILKLKNRIDPHQTNLKDDYQKLAQMAQVEKNKKAVKDWIKKRSKITYIKLDSEYACKFENEWTISN